MSIDDKTKEEYDKRFSREEKKSLLERNISPLVANAYSGHFDFKEIIDFIKKEVSPEVANKYDERFYGLDVLKLLTFGVCADIANEYNPKLSSDDIIELVNSDIGPDKTKGFDPHFLNFEIVNLLKGECGCLYANKFNKRKNPSTRIYIEDKRLSRLINPQVEITFSDFILNVLSLGGSPEAANEYDERFDYGDVVNLVRAGCSSELAGRYSSRFKGYEISLLFKENIRPSLAKSYPKWMNGVIISELHKLGINSREVRDYPRQFWLFLPQLIKKGFSKEIIKTYDSRFPRTETDFPDYAYTKTKLIINLMEYIELKGLPHEIINLFNDSFDAHSVFILISSNTSPQEANLYPSELCTEDIIKFVREGVSAQEIMRKIGEYGPRFHINQVSYLIEKGISHSDIKSYPERFHLNDIISLLSKDICPETSNSFDKRFDGGDILELVKKNISNDQAVQYPKRFKGVDICYLVEAGCSPGRARRYNARFHGWEINYLCKAGISAKQANKYPKDFDGADIVEMYKHKVPLEEYQKWPFGFRPYHVAQLYRVGVKYNDITSDVFSHFAPTLRLVARYLYENKITEKTKLLATGANGIILITEKDAFKFSQDMDEGYLLEDIKSYRNIVKFNDFLELDLPEDSWDPPDRWELYPVGFRLEYIRGESLENILKKISNMEHDWVLKYSLQILHGLMDMREARIYHHRDIRPANIMIDELNDRAVIIDLGFATKEQDGFPNCNRRYGGPNDLVSLGQVMYKMTTGEHIFAESRSMELSVYAYKIRDIRDEIYEDETGKKLEPYLQKVSDNVKHEGIKDIIKACLTAGKDDHGKIKEMFERYANAR